MAHPYDQIDHNELADLLRRSNDFRRRLDGRIELAQRRFEVMDDVIQQLLELFREASGVDGCFIVARDHSLRYRTWRAGEVQTDCEAIVAAHSSEGCSHCPGGGGLQLRCLNVGGRIIGCFGAAPPVDTGGASLLQQQLAEDFCEQVDNYIFAENCDRESQALKMRIGDALKNRIFAQGLEEAVTVLKEHIDFNALVLLYHDEQDTKLQGLKYFIHSEEHGCYDPYHHYDPGMDELVRRHADALLHEGDPEFLERFGIRNYQEDFLISGVHNAVQVGKLIVSSATSDFDVREKELLQLFVSFIQQRVLDFNKEWRNLSQFFSVSQRLRLLEHEDYAERWLSPRVETVAMLYADISSFTFFSEQVLRDPRLITQMFDIWAMGVMSIVWENGGCCDKFVGDCCIAHFGPPFHEGDEAANCLQAVECARAIRRWTREMLKRDEDCFEVLREAGQERPFGVATGINLGSVNVGTIGPNRDFTAFGAEMNNTARIQSKASCDEILLMASAREALGDAIVAAGPFTTELRNVREPVEYYRLEE